MNTSSTAGSGAGRGFDAATVGQIIDLATGGLKPDLTLFFDITVESAMNRMDGRPDSETRRNRMDDETADFYGRVREKYLEIAECEPERFRVIDGGESIEQIHANVVGFVLDLLAV